MPKLSDNDCINILKDVAVGRSARQMAPLLHAAHEAVTLAAEDVKYGALISKRESALGKGGKINRNGQVAFDPDCWNNIINHLADGEGSNHIDVALGLAWKALLAMDQSDFEAKLYLLFKAAHLTFPHVRRAITTDVAPDSSSPPAPKDK